MLVVSPYISNGFDSDTITYINAVEGADNQTLEWNTRMAFDRFIKGCKNDGIWDAIESSCILAGARTLAGALTPLKGTAPTNHGFIGIGTDYNRKNGLTGNASSKYLDSGLNNNAIPQDDRHIAIWMTNLGNTDPVKVYIGSGVTQNGTTHIVRGSGNYGARVSSSSAYIPAVDPFVGFTGAKRESSTAVSFRTNGSTYTGSIASQTPYNGNIFVFSTNPTIYYVDSTISFYSIGNAIDLSLLDSRLSQLMIDINNSF